MTLSAANWAPQTDATLTGPVDRRDERTEGATRRLALTAESRA
jgi:hypothetical protein